MDDGLVPLSEILPTKHINENSQVSEQKWLSIFEMKFTGCSSRCGQENDSDFPEPA